MSWLDVIGLRWCTDDKVMGRRGGIIVVQVQTHTTLCGNNGQDDEKWRKIQILVLDLTRRGYSSYSQSDSYPGFHLYSLYVAKESVDMETTDTS